MSEQNTQILAIESSCDETAAAVVADGRRLLSNVIASQVDLHQRFGGVVPEVASRQHILAIVPVVNQALADAAVDWKDLAGVAVTYGPGLVGSLLVGLNMAKSVAFAHDLPLIGVNHLEGHLYAAWLLSDEEPAFPLLGLIVSGAHSSLVLMTGHGRYQVLGRTIDDAAGEAFDKVARLLGLGYPGGPPIQQAATNGNAAAYALPRAWLRGTYDFSFSGLKTAVLRTIEEKSSVRGFMTSTPQGAAVVNPAYVPDLAASFQQAVVDVLTEKTKQASQEHGVTAVILGGGVAANTALRQGLKAVLKVPLLVPPPVLCTDNAAGIAVAGHFRLQGGERSAWDLDVKPTVRLA
jgi:tRNA N6-adenosine threonylcarbamoyltransferase